MATLEYRTSRWIALLYFVNDAVWALALGLIAYAFLFLTEPPHVVVVILGVGFAAAALALAWRGVRALLELLQPSVWLRLSFEGVKIKAGSLVCTTDVALDWSEVACIHEVEESAGFSRFYFRYIYIDVRDRARLEARYPRLRSRLIRLLAWPSPTPLFVQVALLAGPTKTILAEVEEYARRSGVATRPEPAWSTES